jgi:hypothetical protein
MQKYQNSQTIYQMRKSLLALHRARNNTINSGDLVLARELKRCIDIISRQIKLMSVERK